jgi:hypothetical protein
VQPGDNLDVSLLDHIRRVDPRLQPAIEAQINHAPQARPMPGKKLVQSLLIPGPGLFQKASRLRGVVVHENPHSIRTPEEAVYWTGSEQFF